MPKKKTKAKEMADGFNVQEYIEQNSLQEMVAFNSYLHTLLSGEYDPKTSVMDWQDPYSPEKARYIIAQRNGTLVIPDRGKFYILANEFFARGRIAAQKEILRAIKGKTVFTRKDIHEVVARFKVTKTIVANIKYLPEYYLEAQKLIDSGKQAKRALEAVFEKYFQDEDKSDFESFRTTFYAWRRRGGKGTKVKSRKAISKY